MSWNQKAKLVREGMSQSLVLNFNYSFANAFLTVMIGLAQLPDCPADFKKKTETFEVGCDRLKTLELVNSILPLFHELCDAI